MRFSCVGAVNVLVTRCSSTRRSHAVGSNLRSTTIVAADGVREQRERQRARVVQRPGGDVHLVRAAGAELAEQRDHASRRRCLVRIAPFGLPVVPDV